MKIHLPKHRIEERERVRATDIPLAYVDTKDSVYRAEFSFVKEFAEESSRRVMPYDEMPRPDTMLFDSSGVPITTPEINRQGGRYYYEPKDLTEFTPVSFACQAHIKRHMRFSGGKEYNIRAAVVEVSATDLFLSSRLISIFGDAYRRGICPPNVRINSGAMSPESLIEASSGILGMDSSRTDFLFIESDDGVNLGSLQVQELIEDHTNLWISSSSFGGMIFESSDFDISEAKPEGNLSGVFSQTERKLAPAYCLSQRVRHPNYPESEWEYSFPYEDVLILHKDWEGYIIVTPTTFMDHLAENAKIVYDVMLYTFLNGYQSSRALMSWITDAPVDGVSLSQAPLNQYHRTLNLPEMLFTTDFELADNEYDLINIQTDTFYGDGSSISLKGIDSPGDISHGVCFVSKDSAGNMYFRKIGAKERDPEKPAGKVSLLTTKGTIVIHNDEDVNYVKAKPRLSYRNGTDGFYIIVSPIADSERLLYTKEDIEIEVPDLNVVWYLCARAGSISGANPFSLVEAGLYDISQHGWKIAEVRVRQEFSVNIIDARVPGGGLPANEPNDYDLIDIGNILGRPYRIGSTLIIRLPKRLEKYREIIEDAVKQHIQAGDYPVLLFE